MAEYNLTKRNEEKKAHNWGMLCHLAALSGLIGIPFGHLLGPFIVWLLKKNDYPFVDEQGKESLNFQISISIYGIVAALLILVKIGIILLAGLLFADLILVIIASVKTSSGENYRYPLTIRFIN